MLGYLKKNDFEKTGDASGEIYLEKEKLVELLGEPEKIDEAEMYWSVEDEKGDGFQVWSSEDTRGGEFQIGFMMGNQEDYALAKKVFGDAVHYYG
jgi:hypothetical protein